ncbi:aldo/keto reductase, partial [Candidatus Bathyarchaeota archaeon]|nr:aldo/keto reductase [Candidatus Bathyarchaeota archaeon]
MKYRKMGSLQWKVSALGFGCMRLPPRRINRLRARTEESVRIIRHGIDLGINYIDTAWLYHMGDSEKILGKTLQDGYRERVHLVTKLPMFMVRKTQNFDSYLKTQMKRLKTDYLDGYLFHALSKSQFEKVKRLNLINKMEKAKEEGLIRHIGFSFHDTLPVFREIIDYYPWDIAQIQYNYMDTGIQATTEGLAYAHSKGIAVVVMEPLKGGKLANPPAEALNIINSTEQKRTPVEWALHFLWNRPEISVALSGMSSQKMVDENCTSADRSGINSLSQQDQEVIAKLAEIYRKENWVPCTACGYCMPCPQSVDIPQNFAFLNNASLEKSFYRRWQSRRGYRRLTGSKKKLNKEDPNGNATICNQCGECLNKCPQKINIPAELEKASRVLGKRRRL